MKQFQVTTTDTSESVEVATVLNAVFNVSSGTFSAGNIIKGQTTGVRAKLIDTVVDDYKHIFLLSW